METRLDIAKAKEQMDEVILGTKRGDSTLLVDSSGAAVARVVPVVSGIVGTELARRWENYPHLTSTEAEAFASEVDGARNDLPEASDPWD